ncbi:cache domain-containing protein [Arthrobacter sp. FW305-BF8]|uniref:cache domain-containing protein n=1 Tax=Arthrobacter sp. FW305-BF8 TaxID=2879617 RepID=UPI001F29B3B7|nr:cache domain-containing protein [Arthrobacter sp. FW305-BF8]UKA54611.1 cache domain-containing protein [Arthrobacter sp. FW305-BF8]
MNPINEILQSTAQALGQSLASVFADLAVLADATTDILASPGTSRTKLESLRPVVEDIVLKQAGLVDSAGVSVTSGLFTDADAWHQWWSLVGGKLVFIPHNLNPASINYYDYTEMTWYERPLASGRPELIGPYIDFGGADMKIVTASRPVLHEQRPVAVAGADLSMESIERTFLLNLGRRDEHVALITESGKVVASNSARFAPGTRFEGPRSGPGSVSVPVADLAAPPWRLVADE